MPRPSRLPVWPAAVIHAYGSVGTGGEKTDRETFSLLILPALPPTRPPSCPFPRLVPQIVFLDTIQLADDTYRRVLREDVEEGHAPPRALRQVEEQTEEGGGGREEEGEKEVPGGLRKKGTRKEEKEGWGGGGGREARAKKKQAQLDWLEATLAASTADWLLVAGHFPMYSAGKEGGREGGREGRGWRAGLCVVFIGGGVLVSFFSAPSPPLFPLPSLPPSLPPPPWQATMVTRPSSSATSDPSCRSTR